MGLFKNDVGRPSNETIKKRNIFKGICVVFGLIIIVLVCYILNDKGIINLSSNNKSANNSKASDNTTTATTMTTTMVTTTTEKLEEDKNTYSDEIMSLYIPFSYHMYEASDEELYKSNKVMAKDLSNEYKNRLAFAFYYNTVGANKAYEGSKKMDGEEYELDYFSSDTLSNYYTKLFGKNEKYIAKNFSGYGISSMGMTYDKSNNYYLASLEGGDYTGYRYANELYKVNKNEDKIELYEYVVVYNEDYKTSTAGVYKNIEDANSFKNAIKQQKLGEGEQSQKYKTIKFSNNEIYLDDLSDYKNDASQYKLLFEKEGNNYIFKSIEKIK